MPINKKGGKKFKKYKKVTDEKKIMVLKEDDNEEYAKVIKLLGNGRLLANLKDKTEKLCNIPGRLKRKKTWINIDDIILISIREFQTDKADVIYVYNQSQINILKTKNLLPLFFYNNSYEINQSNEDTSFVFESNCENEYNNNTSIKDKDKDKDNSEDSNISEDSNDSEDNNLSFKNGLTSYKSSLNENNDINLEDI